MLRKFAIAVLATGVVMGSLVPSQAMSINAAPVQVTENASATHYYGYGHGYGNNYGYNRGYSERHYRWCEQRYRSYDRYTNTYKPYYGPRRQCRSPYS